MFIIYSYSNVFRLDTEPPSGLHINKTENL